MRSARRQLGVLVAVFGIGAATAFAAPAPPTLNPPVVAGPQVTLIGGHCGGNPGPNWGDVADITPRSGTTIRWTLRPYLAAGFQP